MNSEPDIRSPGARILVVDDNPSIHRDFDLVLLENRQDADLEAEERQMYGEAAAPAVLKPAYSIDHALSGLEGVEKVQQALTEGRPYQLAFVDIRMPGIDGVETIHRIWQCDPRVQIVICTAFSDYSWEDLLRRLGRTDNLLVLKKPFDNIEVTLLASTLTEKWFLARRAALKQEQMELIVARRTQRLIELGRAGAEVSGADLSGRGLVGAAPEAPESSAAEPSAPGAELPLILLVENEPSLGSQISGALGGASRLILAHESEEGFRQAQETVPDLVLAELDSPHADGAQFCQRLKRNELTSHIPVIMISARGQSDSQLRALQAGADIYLASPLNLTLLKSRVEDLLQARRSAQQHHSPGLQSATRPDVLAPNHADAQFLLRATETVDRHLSDFEFDVDALARKVAVSRRQLFRKLKAVTGVTPNAFIRTMRLNRAAQLLRDSQMTVTEITYAVGFFDLKHFRTLFFEQFGVLPSEYPRKTGPEDRIAKSGPART